MRSMPGLRGSFGWAALLLCTWLARPAAGGGDCDPAEMLVGSASGFYGDRVAVEILGTAVCDVSGFSLAVGHDSQKLRFIEAAAGQFVRDHAGTDLVFDFVERNDEGYAVIYAFFDLSFPITVPPVPIPPKTLLATLVYEILPGVKPGKTALENRSRTYGSPNRISNVYSGRPGQAPIEPRLEDGAVAILGKFEPHFLRGDANGDLNVDISDVVWLLNYQFRGGPAPPCDDAADANDDGRLDISDAIFTLTFLFKRGPPPPAPGPDTPGPDPTEDDLGCDFTKV
jgi:hypothetical protein